MSRLVTVSPPRRGLRLLVLAIATLLGAGLGCSGEGGGEPAQAGLRAEPLTERSGPVDGKGFERLGADRTGVDFEHRFSPDPRHLAVFDNGMAGGGVAIGDVDADGLPDVLLTRPYGGLRLYRNLGEMRFVDVTESAGLAEDTSWSSGASLADVDGDGDDDLYVCGYDVGNRLYLNDGRGVFHDATAGSGLAFTGASIQMAWADIDRDGDLDGYLLTNRHQALDHPGLSPYREGPGGLSVQSGYEELFGVLVKPDGSHMRIRAGQADHLYRNDGHGRFTDVSVEAGISGNHYGLGVVFWDYDEDGWPDLYVANDFFGPDHLYHNDGDGSFTDVTLRALPHTPWFSMGVDVGDVDNDGRMDMLATDMSGSSHFRQKVAMGDMAVSGWFLDAAEPRQYMRNALYLNTGTGHFLEAAFLAGVESTDWTWSPQFGDLDNDGRIDLFVSNGMTRDFFHSDIRERALAAADGGAMPTYWMDTPELRDRNAAYRNLGDLRFESAAEDWGLDEEVVSFGAGLSDLDLDGDLDLVVNHFEQAAGVYRNASTDGHTLLVRLEGGPGNPRGLGATVRVSAEGAEGAGGPAEHVRYVTSTRGYLTAVDPLLHVGLGRHDRVARLHVRWPSGREQSFTDLPADRLYTITEPDGEAGRAVAPDAEAPMPMFIGTPGPAAPEADHADFAAQPLLPYRLSRLGPGLAVADIDGDGDEDYWLGGPSGRPGVIVRNQLHQRFEPQLPLVFAEDALAEDMGGLFFDADADGDPDLYVVGGGVEAYGRDSSYQDRLYLNDGTGRFTRAGPEVLPDMRDSGGVVAAADVDMDGDLDLFVGSRVVPGEYPTAPTSHLLLNQGGVFLDATDAIAPGLSRAGLVTSALWSDADGDDDADLFVTCEWGPVRFWRNDDGALREATAEAGLDGRNGWWNGIAGRDVDHDGDIDYLVTNAGLNSKYHAEPDRPVLLYYGDFDGTGRHRLVEAEFEQASLFPVRGKSCSTNAMPFLGDKFTEFEDFAIASLEDIYTPQCLADAQRFEADTLESGLLLNDGSGHFRFEALPRVAQIAPAFGVVLTDVDGDGHTDAYLAQNLFAPQPETGRMDGGLSQLLLGRGDGSFQPVGPKASGLISPGDGKSLVATDFDGDGWPDMLLGRNDAPLRGFHNTARTSSSYNSVFSVKLINRPGNPSGIGALVTAVLSTGRTETAEVHAGGGYLSQSSAALVFGVPEGAHVHRFEVRWPDGERSNHPMVKGAPPVVTLQR